MTETREEAERRLAPQLWAVTRGFESAYRRGDVAALFRFLQEYRILAAQLPRREQVTKPTEPGDETYHGSA